MATASAADAGTASLLPLHQAKDFLLAEIHAAVRLLPPDDLAHELGVCADTIRYRLKHPNVAHWGGDLTALGRIQFQHAGACQLICELRRGMLGSHMPVGEATAVESSLAVSLGRAGDLVRRGADALASQGRVDVHEVDGVEAAADAMIAELVLLKQHLRARFPRAARA
ncbi:MAG: hypothetical protein H0W72_13780 [Planctomycetes bacterium]|nr:hypothetical protein [Planctomycetota bacterium]